MLGYTNSNKDSTGKVVFQTILPAYSSETFYFPRYIEKYYMLIASGPDGSSSSISRPLIMGFFQDAYNYGCFNNQSVTNIDIINADYTSVALENTSSNDIAVMLVITEIGVYNNTCLLEGTTILMSDGTSKNIEDVVAGDTLLAVEVNPNADNYMQPYTTKVLIPPILGYTNVYTKSEFADGTTLNTVGKHRIYDPSKNMLISMGDLSSENSALKADNQSVKYVGKETVQVTEKLRHYQIVTDTGKYFANGILNGIKYSHIYSYLIRPEYIQYQPDAKKMASYKRSYDRFQKKVRPFNSAQWRQETTQLKKQIDSYNQQIQQSKKLLQDTDYLFTKQMEIEFTSTTELIPTRVETERDIQKRADAVLKRQAARDNINNIEELLKPLQAQLDEINKKYLEASKRR